MSDMPELRDGPPWAMEEMILAEPGLVSPIFASPEAFEAAEWIRETETVVVTGCGTSEHAAMAGAALLGARARDAFEASLDPQREGVLIAVSHEAGTAATLAAMKATKARTILITARPELDTGADLDDRDAARRHVVVPYRRLCLAAADLHRDRRRDRRGDRIPRHRSHARPAGEVPGRRAHARRLRAADRHRQRPRRDHGPRAGAEDRGGPARAGHAARDREGPARAPARGRLQDRDRRPAHRSERRRAARQAGSRRARRRRRAAACPR